MAEKKILDNQLFFKGADSDTNAELMPLDKGMYEDCVNGRPITVDGNSGALSKIKGEEEVYDYTAVTCTPISTVINLTNYTSIGTCSCKGYEIGFWAYTDPSTNINYSAITVNEYIMCYTLSTQGTGAYLPLTSDHPLQIDTNENCKGGEIFITDFNVEPMIFDLQDMIDRYNDLDLNYFTEFNLYLYTITLKKQLDIPVFIELVSTSVLNGLQAGMYAYSFRYVDTTGNRTQWSMYTPLIPVLKNYGTQSDGVYPYTKTCGADEALMCPYKIKLNYRVTNDNNYSGIEFRRIAYNIGGQLGSVPTPQVYIVPTPLMDGEVSIREFIDDDTISASWTTLTNEEIVQTFNIVQKAKSIRYFKNRLELGNIQYPSKDITSGTDSSNYFMMHPTQSDDTVNFTYSRYAYPFMHRMGSPDSTVDATIGHKDPYNATYFKHYMSGERYNYAVLCFDANGDRSFTFPVPTPTGGDYYQMPNRRHKLMGASYQLSVANWRGAVDACTITNDVSGKTFEVFDLVGAVEKTEDSLDISISVRDSKTYRPLYPRYQEDIYSEHEHKINTYISRQAPTGAIDVNGIYANREPYSPKGFAPRYFAMGMAVQGLTNLPSHVKSFSIVRTKAAGRVLCQGLAVYDNTTSNTSDKVLNKIRFYSDDLTFFALSPSTNYRVQFVSPLGYFSELYNSNFGAVSGVSCFKEAELVSYARVLKNNNNINPELQDANNDTVYDTQYGIWRNNTVANPFGSPVDGDNDFEITVADQIPLESGRGHYWELTLGANIYQYTGAAGNSTDVNNVLSKNYHEPVYIVNIIDDSAVPAEQNVTSFIETGHYQKMESVIGEFYISSNTSFQLLDERWEDCIPSPFNSHNTQIDSCNSFIYIEDPDTGLQQAWLNVQYKTDTVRNTILAGLTANGYYDITMNVDSWTTLGTKRIYGVYWHVLGYHFNTIVFSQNDPDGSHTYTTYNPNFFFPSDGTRVVVKYDNRFPIKVFGGDATIGESVSCFLDALYDKDGHPESPTHNDIRRGFPYNIYKYSNNYFRILNAANNLNAWQWNGGGTTDFGSAGAGYNYAYIRFIRQHIWMYTAETRCNLPFIFDEKWSAGDGVCNPTNATYYKLLRRFPNVHYIHRPERWHEVSTDCGDNFEDTAPLLGVISPLYKIDYPAETQLWRYGGFRFGNQNDVTDFALMSNIDYAEWNTSSLALSKPTVGYVEKTSFCTQVIWSDLRLINEQNDPNLRSFPSSNYIDIMDSMGAIKYLWDGDSAKGSNLYAITEKGICLLLTDKNILADLTGGQLGFISADAGFIQGEYWLNQDIGMNDEMWRTAAEFRKSLFFANSESCYVLFDNQVQDIAKDSKYYKRVWGDGLSQIKSGYSTQVSSIVDRKYEEYWLTIVDKGVEYGKARGNIILYDGTIAIGDLLITEGSYVIITAIDPISAVYISVTFAVGEQLFIYNQSGTILRVVNPALGTVNLVPQYNYVVVERTVGGWSFTIVPNISDYILNETFVYSVRNKSWNGTYKYVGEKYISDVYSTYLVRDARIYLTDRTYYINGELIEFKATQVSAPQQILGKEFIDIRIASDEKPTRVDFANDYTAMPECSLYANMSVPANAYYLKDYNGWQNFIPRKTAGDRDRVQGRSMHYDIIHNLATDFNLISTIVGSKLLKIN